MPKVTWTAENRTEFLNGQREAANINDAVATGREYVVNELNGEGTVTIFLDGEEVRKDQCDMYTNYTWNVSLV